MKLGSAFSESITTGDKIASRLVDEKKGHWWLGAGRALIFASIFFVAFFILLWRLFDLTVISGHRLRGLADSNRTRELIIHSPRGNLLDRTGKPLTANIPQYRLTKPCEKTADRDGSQLQSCTEHISKEEGDQLKSEGIAEGWYLEQDYLRQYPYGESLAHIVGYTGELSVSELGNDYYIERNYRPGDRVGRMGAEAVFEERLRGRDGWELVEVDARGNILRSLGRQEEIPGEDISLSLDAGLAQPISSLYPSGSKGAVIVTKPTTGEVLAMYSSPSFSPDAFSIGMSQSQYTKLLDDPDKPLFNRAIGGVYPPGSTFKIVTAMSALEEKAITPETTVEDTGVITIGPFTFPNWYFTQYGRTEGAIAIVKAIQRSNDIFFYKAAEAVGITRLAAWAKKVGIGKPLGIELSGEAGGLMPDPQWKNKQFTTQADLRARNNEWYLGDTYHVGIGQGYLLTTPIQVNAWTNVIASGGLLCRPTIEKKPSVKCAHLDIKPETIKLISEGLEEACAPGGTGWPLFDFGIRKNDQGIATSSGTPTRIPVACKTGTAEFGDPKNRTHAWFTTFAPVPADDVSKTGLPENVKLLTGDPELSVTVLVEGAGEGSNVAAPIAKKIYEEWFSR